MADSAMPPDRPALPADGPAAADQHDDGGYPTDEEWPGAAANASAEEGWGLFDASGSSNGRTQLQRCDDMKAFESDDDAWTFVVDQAKAGSERHIAALRLVKRYNRVEAEAITRFTGFDIP